MGCFRRFQKRKAIFGGVLFYGFVFLLPIMAEAGGPQYVNKDGVPYRWRTSLVLTPDQGGLGTSTPAETVAMVQKAINTWKGVSDSALPEIAIGAPFLEDITATNVDKYLRQDDGITPIIFDNDGTILSTLLCSSTEPSCATHIPGIAFGLLLVDDPDQGPTLQEGGIILNGLHIWKQDSLQSQIVSTAIHELGHLLGLDHTQLNADIHDDGDASNDVGLPTMFPFFHGDMGTLHRDDQAAIAALYPAETFSNALAGITGHILIGPNRRGFQGANVVVRRVDGVDSKMRPTGSKTEAIAVVSGARYREGNPNVALKGLYEAKGLPPGEYLVYVEPMDPRFQDDAGVGPPLPVPFPGRPEYYNGENESERRSDFPGDRVSVQAGTSGVDILLNLRSEIPISTDVHDQVLPRVAFDGENYLVVWQDLRSCTSKYPIGEPPYFFTECGVDIFGARVTPEGKVLDPEGFPISTARGRQSEPAVGFGNGKYFVIWSDRRLNGVSDTYGTFLNPALLDASTGWPIRSHPEGLRITHTDQDDEYNPNLAFDGENFMVVFHFDDTVMGTRVTVEGTVLDQYTGSTPYDFQQDHRIDIGTALFTGQKVPIAYGGGVYLVGAYVHDPTVEIAPKNLGVVFPDGRVSSQGWRIAQTSGPVNVNLQAMSLTYGEGQFFIVYNRLFPRDRFFSEGYILGGFLPVSDIFSERRSIDAFLISSGGGAVKPHAAWDGSQFVVLWHQIPRDFEPEGVDLLGARVRPPGTVLDRSDLGVMTDWGEEENVALAYGKGKFLVVWRALERMKASALYMQNIYGQLMTFPGFMAAPERLHFVVGKGGAKTDVVTLVDPLEINTTQWKVVPDNQPAWLTVLPASGGVPMDVAVTADAKGLTVGNTYEGAILFEILPDPSLPPPLEKATLTVPVVLEVKKADLVLKAISSSPIEGAVGTTSPLAIVSVTTEGGPSSGIEIAWKVTTVGSGTILKEEVRTTTSAGESSFDFPLGEHDAVYVVIAACAECSPQSETFYVIAMDIEITFEPKSPGNYEHGVPFVYPRRVGQDHNDNQAMVKVKLLPEVLPPGVKWRERDITFSVINAHGGGHDVGHTGDRPTGGFWETPPAPKTNTCLTSANQQQEAADGTLIKRGIVKDAVDMAEKVYTSCEVSGEETIEVQMELMGQSDPSKPEKRIFKKTATLRVEVPGLRELQSRTDFALTGETPKHPSGTNHFALEDVNSKISTIASEYRKLHNVKLGINDMSLPMGGAFDICGKWDPEESCPNPNPKKKPLKGHSLHRIGTSVDIDGASVTKKERLKEIIKDKKLGGCLIDEGPIHVEFDREMYITKDNGECLKKGNK